MSKRSRNYFPTRTKLHKMSTPLLKYIQPYKIIQNNSLLIESIPKKFKKIYDYKEDNVNIDKFKIEFEKLLVQYQEYLKQYEKYQRESISVIRKTLSNINSRLKQQRQQESNDEQSERGITANLKMHEVNQETLHYERMIQIKEKEIKQINGKIRDAYKVQQDIKVLTFEQGQKLNIAEDNINNANTNVKEAHENLIEAKKQHISSKKKKMCIFGIIAVLLLVIIVPILIKFA